MMRFGENMELYNEYELISHSKLADCSMFIVDMVYRPMHLHKEMELCYILSGTCRVSTDRQSFTAGAGGVLLFDAGAGHEIWAVGAPARILTLQLSHGFCSRFYPQIRNVRFGCRLLSDCLSEDALHTLQHAMLQAFSEYLLDSPQAMFACMAQIHAIFALLLQGVPYRVLSDTENTFIIAEYDLVIDATDNLPSRYLIDEACVRYGKPFVYGSICEFKGQVSVFNYQGGPTYRDLYEYHDAIAEFQQPQGVIGALPGVVGSIQANEAIKLILGSQDTLSGKLLLIDLLKGSFQTMNFIN